MLSSQNSERVICSTIQLGKAQECNGCVAQHERPISEPTKGGAGVRKITSRFVDANENLTKGETAFDLKIVEGRPHKHAPFSNPELSGSDPLRNTTNQYKYKYG